MKEKLFAFTLAKEPTQSKTSAAWQGERKALAGCTKNWIDYAYPDRWGNRDAGEFC